MWDEETAETQAVLAVWEVIGHLDVLAERGLVVEAVDDRRQPPVPTERARSARTGRAILIPSGRSDVSPTDATPNPLDRFDLTGCTAIVTGATRGLGRAIVTALAGAGADIVIASRKPEACEETAEEVRRAGRRALAVPCHVARWDECEALVEAAYDDVRADRRARQQRGHRTDVSRPGRA